MPKFDARLTELPAETDFLTIALSREIDQSHDRILEFHAQLVQFFDITLKPFHIPFEIEPNLLDFFRVQIIRT
jgi:hypothetical protein